MKFSELTAEQWEEWGPYLDTCILPVTGLTGLESPVEAAERLERLRDWLDGVEIPFHGRTVTYPAYHFAGGSEPQPEDITLLDKVCGRLREQGFSYIIIVSHAIRLRQGQVSQADAVFTPAELGTENANTVKELMKDKIQKMWYASQFEEQL
ncbi:DUF2487 family protein [Paenibacillus dendritiformis]|uniref:DUF2487 family protein n=1 Tax=Paenibacillus dendritiformis TaxID=130049 RepID=UPI00143D9D64|nr:DUF2487 family protein [Paenibacillus dendritiformis]NKI23353.1 DUF2487 family protein [Paenibacillus dendritiformis]NRG00811.1 DUF2487 family protein [Paenibacillus dendritiformis]